MIPLLGCAIFLQLAAPGTPWPWIAFGIAWVLGAVELMA